MKIVQVLKQRLCYDQAAENPDTKHKKIVLIGFST